MRWQTPGSGTRPRGSRTARAFVRDRAAVLAAVVLVAVVAGAALLPEVLAYRYDQQDLDATFQGPSRLHLLGTDQYGRDLLARLAYGGRISLLVGGATVLAAVFAGGLLGGVAAWVGGVVDETLMRAADLAFAFPGLLLAILLAAILGPGIATVVAALALASWPPMARTVRAEVLGLKQRDFVEAAVAQGASTGRILRRHLLRNTVHLVVVRATLDIGPIILAEATLSFLGIGVQRPIPSWGVLIADSFQHLQSFPWLAIAPCGVLSATILALNFVGEGVAEAMDPQSAQRIGRTP